MSEIPVESEQDAIAALERLGSGIIGRSPESNKGDGGSRKSVIF